MAFPLIQDQVEGDYGAAPNTTWDSIKAAGENAAASGLTGAMVDSYNIADLDSRPNQRTMMVPELNQKYPGNNWTEPKKEAVASYIDSANKYKAQLSNRMNLADPSLIGSMGRGAVGMVGDPMTDIAAGVGGGAFRAAGILSGGGLGTALARGAAEGVAVMTPLELANIGHDRMLQRDVSLTDSLENVAMGGVFGAGMEGLGHGISAGMDAYNEKYGKKPPPGAPPSLSLVKPEERPLGSAARPEHEALVVDTAARQMEDGLKPYVDPLIALHEDQRQGVGPKPETDYSGRSSYEYHPIDTSKPVSEEFFHGNTSGNENFHQLNFTQNVNSPDSFGRGVYANDNALKANGYAEGGLVHSFDTKDAKLFPLDEKLGDSEPVVTKFLVDQNMPKFAEEYADGKISAREAYNNLTEAGKDALNQKLKEAGYDGLHFEDSKEDGSTKSNGVMLFDPEDAHPNEAYNSDPSVLPTLSEQDKRSMVNADGDPSRELNYDPQREATVKEAMKEAEKFKPGEESVANEANQAIKARLKAMEENGLLEPAQLKEIEAIKSAMDERAAESQNIIQSMFDCIAGH